MSQNLGIIFIVAGAVFLVVGILLLRRPAHQAVLPKGGNADTAPVKKETTAAAATNDSVQKPEPLKTTPLASARDMLWAAAEAALADGTLTPREETLIRTKAITAGEDPDAILEELRNKLSGGGRDSEVELIDVNQKAGFDFEKYIVKLLDKRYFKIDRWAGDKFVEGRYAAENHDPDLQLRLLVDGQSHPLAIECKWRSSISGNFVQFASEKQLVHYKSFEEQNNTPTFIALGIGGKPNDPARLCIIPVSIVKSPFLHIDKISRFERQVDKPLFYNVENKKLR